MPYTYCGCPLPGDTIGQRFTRLKHRLSVSTPGATGLIPPRRPDALAATHASEHNSVYTGPKDPAHVDAGRKAREEKVKKRRQRDEELVRKGKLDEATLRRNADHEVAFLYPIAFYGQPVFGCVATGDWGYGVGDFGCVVVSSILTMGHPSS